MWICMPTKYFYASMHLILCIFGGKNLSNLSISNSTISIIRKGSYDTKHYQEINCNKWKSLITNDLQLQEMRRQDKSGLHGCKEKNEKLVNRLIYMAGVGIYIHFLRTVQNIVVEPDYKIKVATTGLH